MWHVIPFVAESCRLDPKALAEFARANESTYGIVTDRGEPEVNTWHVDKLVADFMAATKSPMREASNDTRPDADRTPCTPA